MASMHKDSKGGVSSSGGAWLRRWRPKKKSEFYGAKYCVDCAVAIALVRPCSI